MLGAPGLQHGFSPHALLPRENDIMPNNQDDGGRAGHQLTPELLAAIYERMADGVVGYGPDGRIVFCNPAMGLLSGRSIADVMGKSATEAWGEAEPGIGRHLTSSTMEQTIERPDGTRRLVTAKSFTLSGDPPTEVVIYRDVTRAIKAREAQQRTEALFNSFMENSPSAASIKDADGRYVYVNRRLSETVNHPHDKWIGCTDADLWHPEVAQALIANDAEVWESAVARQTIEILPQADGEHHWLAIRFLLSLPAGEQLLARMAIDITRQQEAEEEIRHRLALEGALAAASAVLAGVEEQALQEALLLIGEAFDVDRITLYETQVVGECELTPVGWTIPAAVAPGAEAPYSPEDTPELDLRRMAWLQTRLRHSEMVVVPSPSSLPPGAIAERDWMMSEDIRTLVVVPINTQDWLLGGALRFDLKRAPRTWYHSDLRLLGLAAELFGQYLQRRRADEALLQSQSEIRDRVRQRAAARLDTQRQVDRLRVYEAVVRNAIDVVLITEAEPWDEPGPRILFVNKAFERMTGYTAAEVIGKTPRILQGPKTSRESLAKLRAALEKWEPVEVELCNYRKDGSEFWVELSIFPLADESGWYTHWVGIQREVSTRRELELQRAENQRRQLELEYAERLALLAGGIGHEFNNLLVAIMGHASLLGEFGMTDDDRTDSVGQILTACQRATELTRRLLSFAGNSAGSRVPTLIDPLLGQVVVVLLRPMLTPTYTLVESLLPTGALVLADAVRLQTLFLSLFTGFARFFDGPATTLTISSTIERVVEGDQRRVVPEGTLHPGRYIRIALRGEGPTTGTAPPVTLQGRAALEAILAQSTGIVEGVAREHDGALEVNIWPRGGAEVSLLLPMFSLPPRMTPPTTLGLPVNAGARGSVLVVDDEESVRRVARVVLGRAGYKVVEASDGIAALALMDDPANHFQAVLVDVRMPHMNGDKFLATLRERGNRLPAILSSGYADPSLADIQDRDPYTRWLAKPYQPAQLLEMLLLLSATKSSTTTA